MGKRINSRSKGKRSELEARDLLRRCGITDAERGARNGVLTAVEDFLGLADTPERRLCYAHVPAVLGLGVVFAAVMLGGLGNPLGPLVAGLVIGVSEALTMALTAPAWAPLVSFTLLIAILLFRPSRVG